MYVYLSTNQSVSVRVFVINDSLVSLAPHLYGHGGVAGGEPGLAVLHRRPLLQRGLRPGLARVRRAQDQEAAVDRVPEGDALRRVPERHPVVESAWLQNINGFLNCSTVRVHENVNCSLL